MTTSSTSTSFDPEKAKEGKFQIVPVTVEIPPPEGKAPAPSIPGAEFTEEDLLIISTTLTQIPVLIYPKIPERKTEQIKPFNRQFYLYCIRKKINPFDHYFDEMGIVMAGIALFGGIYQDYQVAYADELNKKKKEPLNIDYDHQKDIDTMKENGS